MVAMALGCLLQVVVAALAWLVAHRRSAHVPYAVFATVAAVSDPLAYLATVALHRQAVPYVGIARVYFHASQALHLAPLVAMAAMVLVAFWRTRRLEHLWGGGAFSMTVLVVTYPRIRHEALGIVLTGIHAGYQAVCLVAIGLWIRQREWPTLTQAAALAVVSGDLALWAGPLTGNVFTDWGLGYGAQFAALGFVLALHVLWLRVLRRPQRP